MTKTPLRGEPAALQQGFGALLQRLVAERRELVEQRRDQRRPGPGDQHRERHPHDPRVQPPQRAGPLHQEQDHEHQRSAEQQAQQQALEQVADEQAERRAIEAEARLDAERAPDRQRQADDATPAGTWTARQPCRATRRADAPPATQRSMALIRRRGSAAVPAPHPAVVPAADPRARDGVVGGLLMGREVDLRARMLPAPRRDGAGRPRPGAGSASCASASTATSSSTNNPANQCIAESPRRAL